MKLLKDLGNLVAVLVQTSFCGDQDVVHVYDDISRSDFFFKDCIHHCLECSRGVYKSKEHNSGLKESSVCFECGLSLITVLYSDIIVSPSYVKLDEPLLFHKLTNKFFNKGKRVGVLYDILIDPAIVLYQLLFAIFLFNKEEG